MEGSDRQKFALRAEEKTVARAAVEREIASGVRTEKQLKASLEVFAPVARTGRLDLSASRSLG